MFAKPSVASYYSGSKTKSSQAAWRWFWKDLCAWARKYGSAVFKNRPCLSVCGVSNVGSGVCGRLWASVGGILSLGVDTASSPTFSVSLVSDNEKEITYNHQD